MTTGTASYGPIEISGHLAQACLSPQARCPVCNTLIHRKMGGFDSHFLVTCSGKVPRLEPERRGASKRCNAKLYVLAGVVHGWVGVVRITDDEFSEVFDLQTHEVDREALRSLEISQAAAAVLATVQAGRDAT